MAKGKTEDSAKARALIKQIFDADEVLTPAEYWRRLIDKPAPAQPDDQHPHDNAEVARTRRFLAEAMKDDPNNAAGRVRKDFETACRERFGIGSRAFDHVWRDTATAVYKGPGPRRKRRK